MFSAENTFAQYIQVNDTYTAEQLVKDVLVNSTCATVFNFSASGGNFTAGDKSYAYFSNTAPAFPFASGIVLSTGRASSAQGPNSYISDDGGSMGWGEDIDLEQALNVSNTVNSTVLEFDFVPQTNKISFDYIFASEEYHGTAQCTYSDGFAFLLKKAGSTDQYQNLAIIPGSSTPVKVTTVHPNVPGGCSEQNEMYFGSYNGVNYPINFNGETVVMKAIGDVEIGETYHIKLVIADEGNYRYDSAIFLGGGSFQSATDLGSNHTVAENTPYCAGENVTLNALQPGTNTYKWFINGLDTGITTPTFDITDNTNTNEVTYSVEVMISGTCLSTGEVKIQFAALPVLSDQTLVQCDDDNDGITAFNLTKLDNLIRNGDTTLGDVEYYETVGGNQITNTTAYSSGNNTIYAIVSNAFRCSSTATITLQIANNPVVTPISYSKCDEDGTIDGQTNFNLNTEVTPKVLNGLPPGLVVEYYATENNAVLQTSPLPNTFVKTTATEESIYARIVNGPDCYGIIEVKIKINLLTPPNFGDETVILCDGNTITLSVPDVFETYDWSGSTDADYQTDITAAGTYTLDVTDTNGCHAIKKFIVQPSAPATFIDAQIVDFTGDNNTILITYTDNGGDYEFSIDGINYQDSPTFTNVEAGEYTIYVKDKNGCLPTPSKVIYVLDYPKYFTPNGDGIHDTWVIKNIRTRPNTTINVFDRFGKLLKQFDSSSNGWNGMSNGQHLPAGDYWFTLTLFNGTTVKSHFTLKR